MTSLCELDQTARIGGITKDENDHCSMFTLLEQKQHIVVFN